VILVDSSVWIDYFNGAVTPETERLDGLLGRQPVAIGDLILAEVLQGFGDESEFLRALRALTQLTVVEMGGQRVAIQAARNFRSLRRRGITVRKRIDSLIATWCIENGCQLLYSDRDFEPFVRHLGLRAAG
jgi:predicted nucleic acid-binding protein